MPSYQYIEHAWLSDILISKLYHSLGYLSLVLIFSLIAFISLAMMLSNTNRYSLPFLILGTSIFLQFFGVRTQVLTWFFYSLLLVIILQQKLWIKLSFLIPILIVLWANLHGGFIIGLFTLFLFGLLESIQNKKIQIHTFILCGVSTLGISIFNPYGPKIWTEVNHHLSDGNLRWYIGEWLPYVFSFDPAFLLLVVISSMLIIRYRSHFSLFSITLYISLLISAFASARNVPLWVLLSLYLTSIAIIYFVKEVHQNKDSKWRFEKVFKIFFISVVCLSLIKVYLDINQYRIFNEESFYPKQAIEFLKSNPTTGQLFSTYEWGGYIIWKMPGQKTFIDGRMPTWKNQKAPSNESAYALEDYRNLLLGDLDYTEQFNKYNIKTVLLPLEGSQKANPVARKFQEWDNFLTELLFGKKKNSSIEQRLKNDGWKKIYQDNIAIIYTSSN